jgi:translation initiation factor 2B subunit (eIF-2B alpha/beta/delta family)
MMPAQVLDAAARLEGRVVLTPTLRSDRLDALCGRSVYLKAEVLQIAGRVDDGTTARVAIATEDTPAINFAFDVTPVRLVSLNVTERGLANDARTLQALHREGA